MHLFITTPAVDGKKLVITEERLVHQIVNVLRLSKGEEFFVQHAEDRVSTRRMVSLDSTNDQIVVATITGEQKTEKNVSNIWLLIALPNKTEKLEMMAQKITEVGVDKIIFRPAQRSQLRTIESNRMERLRKIALEASEQAYRWFVPAIEFVPTIKKEWLDEHRLVMFDMWGEQLDWSLKEEIQKGRLFGVIGPEGGLHPDDISLLEPAVLKTLSLGATTLRMETAAIVAGWVLCNA